jgi:sugar phosphate isomerase/epimerase
LKLSLSNGIFSKVPLEQNLSQIKQIGFENVEFNMKTVKREHEETVYEAKKLLNEIGLNCLTLHSATHYVGDAIEIPKAVYYLKVSAEFAHRLEASTMVIHSNVQRKLPEEIRKKFLKQIFQEVVPYTEHLGVKLSLENLSYANRGYGKNVSELEQILNIANNPNMGITIDTSHAFATGVTDSLIEKFHTKLSNIHLSRRRHGYFTEQEPSLVEFLKKVTSYHYTGPITIELSRRCSTQEIIKTKTVIEKIIESFQ